MREIITLIICVVVFMIALQSGIVRTGIEYETTVKMNETLQANNERLSQEIKNLNSLSTQTGDVYTSPAQMAWLEQIDAIKLELKKQLSAEIKTREVVLDEKRENLQLMLLDKLLFVKQTDELAKNGKPVLNKIAGILNGMDKIEIMIIGYTDNQPLPAAKTKVWPTLRHLAAARAIAVAEFFRVQGKIDPVQILAGGYGDVRPIVPNDTDYHRILNGRLEISFRPIDEGLLEKTREIYRTELLVPMVEEKPKKVPTRSKKLADEEPEEPINEESLEPIDGSEFDAGYDKPTQ